MVDNDAWRDEDEPDTTEEKVVENEAEETEGEKTPEPKPEDKPKGDTKKQFRPKGMPEDEEWEHVDIDDDRLQRRINRIYANSKRQERIAKEAIDSSHALLDKIGVLENRLAELEHSDSKNEVQSQIKSLTAQRKEAYDKGDDEKVFELTDQIVELKRSLKTEPTKKEEPKKAEVKEEKEEEEPKEGGVFTPEETQALKEWASETNKRGELVRPWYFEDHPDHYVARKLAEGILERNEKEGEPASIGDVLTELDDLMGRMSGKQKIRRQPENITGGDTTPAKASQVTLSEEQKYVARKMFNNMKPREAEKAYAEALATDFGEDW